MEAHLPAVARLLRLLTLHLPLILAAAVFSRRLYPRSGPLVRWVTGLTLYFLAVAVSIWVVPRVSYGWLQVYALLFLVPAAWIHRRTIRDRAPDSSDHHPRSLSLAPLLALFGALFLNNLYYPGFNHDPLTYQLNFAAAWLQEGRRFIVPTPFGDPSQAYGAALASTFYVWLMAPLQSDLLAAGGGLAFFMLTGFAAMGIARELGAEPRRLLLPVGLLTLSPLLFFEATRALSDIAVAAFFTASIYFFLRAVRTGDDRDLALGLIAAGLTAGGKFTALGLLLPLAPLALLALGCARRPAEAAVGAALGFAGGGLWYARNWALTGNPVYPIRVSVAGHELFPGLYDRGVMTSWIFHRNDWIGWLGVVEANLSLTALALGLVAVGWYCLTGARLWRGRDLPAGFPPAGPTPPRWRGLALIFAALAPVLVDQIDWRLYPFQVDRFWIPAMATLAAVTGAFVSRSRRLSVAALPVVAAGFIFVPQPAYLGGLNWYWARGGIWLFALGAWLWQRQVSKSGPRTLRWMRPAAAGLVLLLLAALVPALAEWPARRSQALADWEYSPGWQALPPGSSTVAYTGVNLPHALRGPDLERRVIYVSTDGRVMAADHEVMADQPPVTFRTPEPVVSRLHNCPARWARALAKEQVDYLIVMRLMRNALVNTTHDREGWPVEDRWARENPKMFEPVFADPATRIYRRRESAAALAAMPDECFSSPADAPTACSTSQSQCDKFFPLAIETMRKMGYGRNF